MVPLLLSAVIGCGATVEPVQPDIVMVLVAGLRAPPGGTFDPGPGLAHEHRLDFTRAYAQSTHVYTSAASVWTGRYVASGPFCTRGDAKPQEPGPFCAKIPAYAPDLPEVLGLYGYHTALIDASGQGLSLLEADFATLSKAARGRRGGWDRAAQAATEWWGAHADKPRLLVVTADLTDAYTHHMAGDLMDRNPMSAADREATLAADPLLARRLKPGRLWPVASAEARAAITALYDQQVQGVVAALGPLLLPAEDDPRPRFGVLAGLHGVSLGEISGSHSPDQLVPMEHLVILDRTIHVPLILFPDRAYTADTTQLVELVDLLPTVAARAGAVPPAQAAGRDLLAPGTDDGLAYAEFGDMLAVRRDGDMLVFRSQEHGITSANPLLSKRLERVVLRSALVDDETRQRHHTDDPISLDAEFLLHEVTSDPYQRAALPITLDDPRFLASLKALHDRRSGPAAPPVATMTQAQRDTLQQDRRMHYW